MSHGTAIHAPFQELEPVDVPLQRSVDYTTLSHQLAQLDVNKQAGQWARLYKQVRAAEARLRQAEHETPPSSTTPPEYAKPQAAQVREEGAALPLAETAEIDEQQAQLHTIVSDLLYWKGGLKVLRQAQLPKWQIEAKIDNLQAEYARLRAGAANEEG